MIRSNKTPRRTRLAPNAPKTVARSTKRHAIVAIVVLVLAAPLASLFSRKAVDSESLTLSLIAGAAVALGVALFAGLIAALRAWINRADTPPGDPTPGGEGPTSKGGRKSATTEADTTTAVALVPAAGERSKTTRVYVPFTYDLKIPFEGDTPRVESAPRLEPEATCAPLHVARSLEEMKTSDARGEGAPRRHLWSGPLFLPGSIPLDDVTGHDQAPSAPAEKAALPDTESRVNASAAEAFSASEPTRILRIGKNAQEALAKDSVSRMEVLIDARSPTKPKRGPKTARREGLALFSRIVSGVSKTVTTLSEPLRGAAQTLMQASCAIRHVPDRQAGVSRRLAELPDALEDVADLVEGASEALDDLSAPLGSPRKSVGESGGAHGAV